MGVPKKRTSISKSKQRRHASYFRKFTIQKIIFIDNNWAPQWAYYRKGNVKSDSIEKI